MEKEEKKEEPIKYGILSNVLFMLKTSFRTYKSVPVLILLESLLYTGDNLISIFFAPAVLSLIQSNASIKNLLITIFAFAFSLMLLRGLLSYLQTNHLFGRIGVRSELIFMIGSKAMNTSYNNLDNKDFEAKKNKAMGVTGGNSESTEAIWTTLQGLLQYLLCFIIYLVILASLNLNIILITILTTCVSFFITNSVSSWMYKRRDEENKHVNHLRYITQTGKNKQLAKDIRLFGMEAWLKELYEKHLRLYSNFHLEGEKRYFFADLADLVLTFLRNGLIYYWLISLVLQKNISVPQFILYFAAAGTFTQWVSGILNQFSVLHKQSLDISRLREFFEFKEDYLFEKGEKVPLQKENLIELKEVSLLYSEGGTPVLDRFNLTLKPKEKLAIVGLNGAGKTSLVKLITGLYDPSQGEVLFNGKNIKEFNRGEYYKCFSAVFQEFSILPTSIAVNIAQSREDINKERIEEVLKLSGLYDKVQTLPQKEETRLCKDIFFDAVELSGGETQKLLLARALYNDRPFLILDEPTAALDPIAEHELYTKYNDLSKDKTSIFISHRLASTRFCDRIIFIKDGKIIEEGTHDSLLKKGGEYAHLFEVQSKYYKEEQDKELPEGLGEI
ncbi:ABC transporter ATP-binding protein [Treponema denticola]|uniref:ABC transporter ATP-binding protein n=1 Tax=Treponema denticola TaxID=158 RepID=UPI0001FD3BE5|nr:ABC transporter ATP-binding protein [Treponema denticola]EGC76304.1 HlyB family ABC transporter [Treponema denticola F0402]